VRVLTLNETFDAFGRLIQLLGTSAPLGNQGQGFGRGYTDPTTEVVNQGALEVWEILNLTGDTHPMHFHLVNVQVLARQPIKVTNYNGGAPKYAGPPVAPALNEIGWKETVRMNPGEATRILIKFALPTVPFAVPSSPRATTAAGSLGITVPPGKTAHEYVWHCHILEHEEHDMMRPLVVTS
jgi:FtsP/CotA-like multicopper oxidase with cupredoxin domain